MKSSYLFFFTAITLGVCTLSEALFAQEPSPFPFYIRLTHEYKYPGTDLVSFPGMIEQVIADQGDSYILSTPLGTTVPVPKSLVMRVSDREAAAGLIEERKDHHKQMVEAYQYLQQASQLIETLKASQTQGGADTSLQKLQQLQELMGKGTLSRNDKIRMLYVLREERMISSIRQGESLSNDKVIDMYNRAMEQRRLRGIEDAVRELQR